MTGDGELGDRRLARLGAEPFQRHFRNIALAHADSEPGRADYLRRIARVAGMRNDLPEAVGDVSRRLLADQRESVVADLVYAITYELGIDVADWDFRVPDAVESRREVPLVAYLDRVRSPFNVGSIIRTAEALGFRAVVLGEGCPSRDHGRVARAAMGSDAFLPVKRGTIEAAEALADGPAVALETTGVPLGEAPLPPAGVLVVGSEERGIEPRLLEYCQRRGGVRSIPLGGAKRSLNVGVAFGIGAAAWARSAVRG